MKNTTSQPPYRMFLLYLLLTFYCFGAAMMSEIVNYRSWMDLGAYLSPAEFAQWHTVAGPRAVPVLVLPMVAATLVALSLPWYLPPTVPRWCLWVVLACHALAWISTIWFQIPLEMQLDQGGYSAELMAELWRTDWLRKLAFLIEIPVVSYMAVRFFQPAASPAVPPLPQHESISPIKTEATTSALGH
jgi:hypothetical protein